MIRAKFNVSFDISTSQHGQILVCQIHLKRLLVSWEHSGNESVQKRGQLSFIVVRELDDRERL